MRSKIDDDVANLFDLEPRNNIPEQPASQARSHEPTPAAAAGVPRSQAASDFRVHPSRQDASVDLMRGSEARRRELELLDDEGPAVRWSLWAKIGGLAVLAGVGYYLLSPEVITAASTAAPSAAAAPAAGAAAAVATAPVPVPVPTPGVAEIPVLLGPDAVLTSGGAALAAVDLAAMGPSPESAEETLISVGLDRSTVDAADRSCSNSVIEGASRSLCVTVGAARYYQCTTNGGRIWNVALPGCSAP